MNWAIIYKYKSITSFVPFGRLFFKSEEGAKKFLEKIKKRNSSITITDARKGDIVISKQTNIPYLIMKIKGETMVLRNMLGRYSRNIEEDKFYKDFSIDLKSMDGSFKIVSNDVYIKRKIKYEQ